MVASITALLLTEARGHPALERDVKQEALLGEYAVLDVEYGTRAYIRTTQLVLEQEHASLVMDQTGAIVVSQPADPTAARRRTGLPVLIEEEIRDRLLRGIRLAAKLLDRIDRVRRLSDVAVVVSTAAISPGAPVKSTMRAPTQWG